MRDLQTLIIVLIGLALFAVPELSGQEKPWT